MMNVIRTHKDLVVWNKSIQFVSDIYSITSSFPEEEKFGIISQLRRAAVSVPTKIAEGSGRKSTKELMQFLYISLGSISEIETLITISKNLGFISNEVAIKVTLSLDEIRKMTSSLIKTLKNKQID